MALIRQINRIGAAGYGVNILEEVPPPQVVGVGTGNVAVIGAFPWGPENQPLQVSGAALFETFAPLEFQASDDYPSLKAFMGVPFPALVYVVRVPVTDAAAASATFPHTSSTDSVTVTARYKGAVGNQIRISFADNATTAANSDMTVKVLGADGTTVTYQAVYENAIVDDGTTLSVSVEAAADPFVVTTIASGAPDTAPDEVTDAALDDTAGSDGTAIVGDWTGVLAPASGASVLSDSSTPWNVAFGAEVPNSFVDGWNDAVKTFADLQSGSRFCVMSTPTAEAVADALTNVDSGQRTDRALRPWRRVKVTNLFDPDRAVVTLDPNADAAAAIANVAPEVSPGGANGVAYMGRILGVEDDNPASDAELESLTDGGLTPVVMAPALNGAILRNARTTSTTSVDSRRVFRRRMTDFISTSIANVLVQFAERPLDVDIVNRRLGPVTLPEIGAIKGFLEDLRNPNTSGGQRIRAYELDPYGANTQTNIDQGTWIITLRVKLLSMQEQIVLRLQTGTTVQVEEA